jgi:aspartate 1-decarboxylase
LPADTEGDQLMLTVTDKGESALEVDGRPTNEGVDVLERIAGGRFEAYVLRATRIRGHLWEIGIDPL